MIAVSQGQTKVVELLLENQTIDLNLRNKGGCTALMLAANRSDVKMVEYLIKKGADPEIKDSNGHSTSYYADGENKDEIIKLLSQAIEKKQQDSILKELKRLFSAQEIEEMQCKPSNSFSDSSGKEIDQCDFEKLQQEYLVNLGSKKSGQDFSAKNLILIEPNSLSSKIADGSKNLISSNSPSTTIKINGPELLVGVAAGVASKHLVKKLSSKKKQGEKTQ